jgi:pantothenate synthetase
MKPAGEEKRVSHMQLIEDLETFLNTRSRIKEDIGLVPTMGFLHEGHKVFIIVDDYTVAHVVV